MIDCIEPNPQAGKSLALACFFFASLAAVLVFVFGFGVPWPFNLLLLVPFAFALFLSRCASKFYTEQSLGSARITFQADGLEFAQKGLFNSRKLDLRWAEIDWFGKAKGRSDWALVIKLSHKGAVRLKRVSPSMRENALDILGRKILSVSDNAFALPIDDVLESLRQAVENGGFHVENTRGGKRFTLTSERSDNGSL